jgi:hypothetical protein
MTEEDNMRPTVSNADREQQRKNGKPSRLIRISSGESDVSDMLYQRPVVNASGELIGKVQQLILDIRTRQLRFVAVSCRKGRHVSEIAIPWKTLYFDSAKARLVFYTLP